MLTIKKSSKLDGVAYEVRGRVAAQASALEAQGAKIIKLNIGNPAPFGFETPMPVLSQMQEKLSFSEGYSESRGVYEAREAIAAYHRGKGIESVLPDYIYTGNGVSELINMSLQALLNDGDEVLIPSPDYPLWTASVTLSGGKPVHYICDEQSDWMPDLSDMRRKISRNTKAIVVINPNNPTGANYTPEILEKIVDLAREFNLVLLSDEIYDRLLMDGEKHTSIATLCPDLLCVTYNGLSKSHLATGFRCGWIALSGPFELAKEYIDGLDMLASMRLCANVPAQSIIPIALQNLDATRSLYEPGGRIYEQREAICDAVNAIEGLSVMRPRAAFYCFPKIDMRRYHIVDDERFAIDFLRAEHVLLVQGSGFNWPIPDHFRIVFLPEAAQLREAMTRLGRFLSTYQQ